MNVKRLGRRGVPILLAVLLALCVGLAGCGRGTQPDGGKDGVEDSEGQRKDEDSADLETKSGRVTGTGGEENPDGKTGSGGEENPDGETGSGGEENPDGIIEPEGEGETGTVQGPDEGDGRTDGTGGQGSSGSEHGTADTETEKERKEAEARRVLAGMTLEEKVGQMFLARCPQENAPELAAKYALGGYLFFAVDFENRTPKDASDFLAAIQRNAAVPMLLGVDEEGGLVNRVSKFKAFRAVPFWSPQDLYAEGGWDLIESDTKEKSELLGSLGLNVNLAPVCDVSTDANDFIHARSFGEDAEQTAEFVRRVVTVMGEEDMGSVLKHFPGYGNNVDTHTGIAVDKRDAEQFRSADFLPFQAGIDAGAGAVLVSHNIVLCMDEGAPASLSAEVHRILREELEFDGVIMTDDLSMDAVKEYAGAEEAAVLAVMAGNDCLCCTDFEVQAPAVLAAVRDGRIPEEQIDASVLRILNWKLMLGIL